MDTPDIRIDPTVVHKPFDRAEHCRQIAHLGGRAKAAHMTPEERREEARMRFRCLCEKYDYTTPEAWALIRAKKPGGGRVPTRSYANRVEA